MKIHLDCLSCLVRQTVDGARRATKDERAHEVVARRALHRLADMDFANSPPVMAEVIQDLIREETGEADMYGEDKTRSNELALRLAKEQEQRLRDAEDPFEVALRLAVAGNIIDFGAHNEIDDALIERTLHEALSAPLDRTEVEQLRRAAREAHTILYLADNAGEIAFDRLFIEQLGPDKVMVAVKSRPILNDALMADAEAVGLCDLVKVVENGTGIPGTVLERTSEEFQRLFESADMVISKGQGNYETLGEAPREIFFLLKVKCQMVARQLDEPIGTLLVRRQTPAT
ncbi:MAG: DUF89 family protein, partial [Lentisphaeria bacterium]|nr:DUF89 family protein [Lentisphaeria bacterium]